jgi:hypothetical protein
MIHTSGTNLSSGPIRARGVSNFGSLRSEESDSPIRIGPNAGPTVRSDRTKDRTPLGRRKRDRQNAFPAPS